LLSPLKFLKVEWWEKIVPALRRAKRTWNHSVAIREAIVPLPLKIIILSLSSLIILIYQH